MAETRRRQSLRDRGPERGFSLFEALAATLIASLLLAGLLQLFGTIWRESGRADETVMATLAARTILVRLRQAPLADGQRFQGVEAGLSWQAIAAQMPLARSSEQAATLTPAPAGAPARRRAALRLHKVTVDVELPSGRHVILESLVATGRQ